MKKLLLILPVALLCFILMTGQNSTEDNPRWSIDPRSSVIYSNGDYNNLPSTDIGIKQFTFAPRTIITPIGVMVASPNVRVHPSAGNQQCETDIVRHPTNPNIMFASAQPIINSNNFMNAGVYVTTDGGLTWNGRDTMNAPNLNDQRGDPAPIIDKNGTFLYGHLTSTTNFGGLTGMGANYSTNNGATWSSTFQIMANANVDKNMTGTDGSPSSPFFGNSYMAWTVFAGTAGDGRVSRTTNGGVSWDPVITINSTPANHFAQGHDVAVAPNGNVFVCWTAGSSTSPFTEDFVGIAKSTDGGVTYTATENAYDVNGSRSTSFNGWGIRTNGFPRIDIDKSGGARNGWIYIVDGQINLAPAGSDADVILRRSSDNGATWSNGIRVNQDALNNGKVQFFPVVNVDDAGGVNVVYYDNRNFPSVGDSCSVYMSRSIDGGNTWTDLEVADHHFKPKNLPGINTMGDYIGVTSGNGKVWPVWMDDKAGPGTQFNIWTTNVQISTFPLNSFNLTPPTAGTTISTLPNSTTQYNFGWDTSASTASYKWIFGSPSAASRQITLPPSGNSLTISGGQLDNILIGLGLNQGDSLVGSWDVWAFRNNATNDSMKATNGPRTITLKRARPSLTAFNLISPPNNTTLLTLVTNTTPVNINWTKSGQAVNYRWLYASPNFSNQANVKLRIAANNSGFDSSLTLRNSQVDSAIAGIGVN
ncbi:MAG: sialidase family protein, partial [Ignavibacteria bacterium]